MRIAQMNKNSKLINNVLKLRRPQTDSLDLLELLCKAIDFSDKSDLDSQLDEIKKISSTFKGSDGRDFPSVCFALATGVGKTRLMGAFIAYLYYEKGIQNFFVMAPNLTIYKKLVEDFGNVSSTKYVFKGLDAFTTAPRIIHGDNYEEFRQTSIFDGAISINIFNNRFC